MSDLSRSTVFVTLGLAAVAGVVIGTGLPFASAGLGSGAAAPVHDAAVALGVERARPPQAGDTWLGCNDARAAGTAPIYRNEPGYRESMDGDGDGIACEATPDNDGGGRSGGRKRRRR